MSKKKVLAWHILREPRLANGDGRRLKVGKTYRHEGTPVLCRAGLHASKKLSDAFGYVFGDYVCRVELSGEMKEGRTKISASQRRVLGVVNLKRSGKAIMADVVRKYLSCRKRTPPKTLKPAIDWLINSASKRKNIHDDVSGLRWEMLDYVLYLCWRGDWRGAITCFMRETKKNQKEMTKSIIKEMKRTKRWRA
jgi:hypothetical protein